MIHEHAFGLAHDLEAILEHETDDAKVGRAFRQFIAEANHGSWDGWEGESRTYFAGAMQLCYDFGMWLQNFEVEGK